MSKKGHSEGKRREKGRQKRKPGSKKRPVGNLELPPEHVVGDLDAVLADGKRSKTLAEAKRKAKEEVVQSVMRITRQVEVLDLKGELEEQSPSKVVVTIIPVDREAAKQVKKVGKEVELKKNFGRNAPHGDLKVFRKSAVVHCQELKPPRGSNGFAQGPVMECAGVAKMIG